MVIQDVEVPMEISRKKKKGKKSKTVYSKTIANNPFMKESVNSSGSCVETPEKSKRKKTRSNDYSENYVGSSDSTEVNEQTTKCDQGISDEDLQELRDVYKKCKTIVKKIETKYGHLLEHDEGSINKISDRKRKFSSNINPEEPCQCLMNKKIVFDDSGNEVVIDVPVPIDTHICSENLPESIKPIFIPAFTPQVQQQIEQDISLPDNIKVLSEMLRDLNLDITLRNSVIKKINHLRAENSYEMRMNKNLLVKMIQDNFEDVIDFQGTNLDSLPGYIM